MKHVSTPYPFGGRSNTNVLCTIEANSTAGGVSSVTQIIARFRGIGGTTARGRVNSVPPVVIVIHRRTQITSILIRKRRMGPVNTGICRCNHHSFSLVSQIPDLRRADPINVPLNRSGFPCFYGSVLVDHFPFL